MSDDKSKDTEQIFEDFGTTLGNQLGNLSSITIFQSRAILILANIIKNEPSISKESKEKLSEIFNLIDGTLDLLAENSNQDTVEIAKKFLRGEYGQR